MKKNIINIGLFTSTYFILYPVVSVLLDVVFNSYSMIWEVTKLMYTIYSGVVVIAIIVLIFLIYIDKKDTTEINYNKYHQGFQYLGLFLTLIPIARSTPNFYLDLFLRYRSSVSVGGKPFESYLEEGIYIMFSSALKWVLLIGLIMFLVSFVLIYKDNKNIVNKHEKNNLKEI